jgi:hypothetical protein
MLGAIHPLPQYAFMAWCSVKSTGITLPLPFLKRLGYGLDDRDSIPGR